MSTQLRGLCSTSRARGLPPLRYKQCRRSKLPPCSRPSSVRCRSVAALLELPGEVSQRASPASHVHHLHHLVNGGATGALYLATFCALSIAVGACIYNLFGHVAAYLDLQQRLNAKPKERSVLHGVDVTGSNWLRDPAVLDALEFAAAAHAGQTRKTGEPYVAHCIEAALIVEKNLPRSATWRGQGERERHRAAVIATLLHDVLDDTPVQPEEVVGRFGPHVGRMVEQVSKLSQVNQMLRRDKRKGVVPNCPAFWHEQWQRLKRMMVEAVVEEPLVLLVKLADRLHNMRTVYALPPSKQVAVAEETLEVWCSMAAYLGWYGLKSEMEDLCFAVIDPDTFCSLRQQLDQLWAAPPAPRRRQRAPSKRQQQLARVALQQEAFAAEAAFLKQQRRAARRQRRHLGWLLGSGEGEATATETTETGLWDTLDESVYTPAGTTTTSSSRSSGPRDGGTGWQVPVLRSWLRPRDTASRGHVTHEGAAAVTGAVAGAATAAAAAAVVGDVAGQEHGAAAVHTEHMSTTGSSRSGTESAPTSSSSSSQWPGLHLAATWWLTQGPLPEARQLRQPQSSGSLLPAPPPVEEQGGHHSPAPAAAEGGGAERPWSPWVLLRQLGAGHLVASATPASRSSSGAASPDMSSSGGGPEHKVALSTPQQQQLRNILSMVVPFDAVSFQSARGLTWSTQRGLSVLDAAADRLFRELNEGSFGSGLEVSIQGRLKSLRSISSKMERKACSLQEVYDARALRVIVDDMRGTRSADAIQTCYRLAAAVHKVWRQIDGEFDDYIANPKPSGYQALHTAVWGPGGAALEVQIKTSTMHEHAEYGGAAHWAYKEAGPVAVAAAGVTESSVLAANAGVRAAPAVVTVTTSSSSSNRSSSGAQLMDHGQQQAEQQQQQQEEEEQELMEGSPPQRQQQMVMTGQQWPHMSTGAAAAAGGVAMPAAAAAAMTAAAVAAFDSISQLSPSSSSGGGGGGGGGAVSSSEGAAAASGQAVQGALAGQGVAASAMVTQPGDPSGSSTGSWGSWQQTRSSSSSSSSSSDGGVAGVVHLPPVMYTFDIDSIEDSFMADVAAAAASSSQSSRASSSSGSRQGGHNSSGGSSHQQLRPPSQPKVYAGQPILRVSDRLRYGVLLSCEGPSSTLASSSGSSSGSGARQPSLLCLILNGSTDPAHPLRVPDYSFYAQLRQYAIANSWNRPGQGDFRARVEEYVLCRDGRYHRVDHMGVVHPDTTLTPLEGYERDLVASVAAAAAADATSEVSVSPGAVTGTAGGPPSQPARTGHADATGSAAFAAGDTVSTAVGVGSDSSRSSSSPAATIPATLLASSSSGSSSPSPAASPMDTAVDEAERRQQFARQWQATAAKAAQLRSIIEWGQATYKAEGLAPAEAPEVTQSGDVSVLIWPGGIIEEVPRGTTAGQILRDRGVLAVEGGLGPAVGQSDGQPATQLVNVNNQLVDEDTVLSDGDLVILARERLKI